MSDISIKDLSERIVALACAINHDAYCPALVLEMDGKQVRAILFASRNARRGDLSAALTNSLDGLICQTGGPDIETAMRIMLDKLVALGENQRSALVSALNMTTSPD